MYYVLDEDGAVIPVEDVLTWAHWFETANRHVADDTIDGVRISTVFLGMNHRFVGDGPPILWETIVFGGPYDGEMVRYSSRDEALRGHQAICRKVSKGET